MAKINSQKLDFFSNEIFKSWYINPNYCYGHSTDAVYPNVKGQLDLGVLTRNTTKGVRILLSTADKSAYEDIIDKYLTEHNITLEKIDGVKNNNVVKWGITRSYTNDPSELISWGISVYNSIKEKLECL